MDARHLAELRSIADKLAMSAATSEKFIIDRYSVMRLAELLDIVAKHNGDGGCKKCKEISEALNSMQDIHYREMGKLRDRINEIGGYTVISF